MCLPVFPIGNGLAHVGVLKKKNGAVLAFHMNYLMGFFTLPEHLLQVRKSVLGRKSENAALKRLHLWVFLSVYGRIFMHIFYI